MGLSDFFKKLIILRTNFKEKDNNNSIIRFF